MENMVNQIDDFELVKNYFRGKKVFLTGHTGFKGSWFLVLLDILGAKTKGYALSPKNENSLFFSIIDNCICESVIGDIRDREKLKKELSDFQPDFIFHLAAQPLVKESYINPVETFETNVIGTSILLDSIKVLKKDCVCIVITTDKVYENKEWDYPYRECDVLGGHDPYSTSKACTELVSKSFYNSYFSETVPNGYKISIATARAGNVIGGSDWSANRIIPDIIRSFMSNVPLNIRSPRSIRPWQHVIEPLVGYLKLGIYLKESKVSKFESFNFGPLDDDCISVMTLVQVAIKHLNHKIDISEEKDSLNFHEAKLLKLDINKTINILNWKPKFNSTEAVGLTIDWYKKVLNGQSPLELSRFQILSYFEK
ncbi:MAG: CDP-glucose 4,6-dehydratase [Cytophagaceae bacterium]|nr:CDP-glucose 4,6-dehydratase [Cytophagaceae bacterium]